MYIWFLFENEWGFFRCMLFVCNVLFKFANIYTATVTDNFYINWSDRNCPICWRVTYFKSTKTTVMIVNTQIYFLQAFSRKNFAKFIEETLTQLHVLPSTLITAYCLCRSCFFEMPNCNITRNFILRDTDRTFIECHQNDFNFDKTILIKW